ncbi:DegV family protein [Acholeplasma hippikon]|uniref:DegV family protein n=1 Tax=Acholeplasma hippikon TaxID=264636 RepID=A0A449BKN5_9MOLU|nr:DegV family protein [Acholeplasma hippikon]VEU82982.1 DegV family protein [Acholeplasma hippikon]
MKKIAVVTCSTSGLDYLPEKDRISILRMTVTFDQDEYLDYVDIKAEDFYQKMLDNPNAEIHTSQIPVGKFVETFETLKQEGYEGIIVITISSKLSGTYQGAVLAKDMVEGIDIEVIDSKSVSYGEAFLAVRALRMIEENKSLKEIKLELELAIQKCQIYVLVDTLKYLVKNGRLSSTAGILGSLLKIKPLLKITEEGYLKPYEKIRTTSKAQKRALEILFEETKNKDVEYFIAFTTNKEKAEEIKSEILAERPGAFVTLIPLTPVVGAHAGPGTLGLGYSER